MSPKRLRTTQLLFSAMTLSYVADVFRDDFKKLFFGLLSEMTSEPEHDFSEKCKNTPDLEKDVRVVCSRRHDAGFTYNKKINGATFWSIVVQRPCCRMPFRIVTNDHGKIE